MTGDGYDLLELGEDELDLRLGEALYADEFGAKDPSDTDKRRRAENWFALRRDELRQAVCGQPFVKGYVGNKTATERELFDAVVAALAALGGIPVPLGVLAAKIVRYGVTKLCPIDQTADSTMPATTL